MAGIIKNQILKHLSRFVKNLSSDKISVSTLKGEGELNNLELEEDVLTELLALPTWMKLTQAHCNRVLIRIQWTKLKSVPIHLSLDEVHIRVQACEELRQGTPTAEVPAIPTSLGKYGFVNKVIDGITATVNSVEITFHSQAFESKVQISRIRVESKSPEWKKVELSGTRLKDMQKGETLIFKEMEWQTLRLEARSTTELHLAPLRLLTNQAKARIVMKKKLSDSQVVGCRLSLILDDLLWVLTDSQILAALHFINSLSGLIKQATEMTQKVKAARKLESLPEYQAQLTQANAMQRDPRTDVALKTFDAFDVKETSYHFICEKIDLHFCDDPGNGRSQHPDLKEGGALQLSLTQVMVDFYPYHLARGSRRSWPKYPDNTLAQWLHQALQTFRISLIDTLSVESMHPPLTRTQNQAQSPQALPDSNQLRDRITEQFAKLMTTCLILKVQELRLFRVTTASKRESPQPFVSTFIERPKDLPVIHTEFSWFYYPGEICFPLPSPKIYAHIHPIQIHLDTCTILWMNAFVSNLQHSMTIESPPQESDYVDIRIEVIMPKVIFENKTTYLGQSERPQSVHFQVSRMVLSNYRSADTGTMHQLTQCLELLQRGDLVYGTDFPSTENDVNLVAEKFLMHAEGRDKLRALKKIKCTSFQELARDLTKDMLWTDPRDVWYIFMDPFWADFRIETKKRHTSVTDEKPPSTRRSLSRKTTAETNTKSVVYPFVDSVPLTVWLHPSKIKKGDVDQQNIQALFSANGICKVQLNHYQYLFVMRMAEALGELSLFIALDSEQIVGKTVLDNLVTFLGCAPSIEVSLLFPQPLPDKVETPSLEVNSTIPESFSADAELDHPDPKSLEGHSVGKSGAAAPLPVSLSTPALSAPVSLSNSPLNLHGSNPALESIRSSLTQNMKHGVSNLAVAFNKGGISTPDSEITSNWSNFSSESSSENNFINLDVVDPESTSLPNSRIFNHLGEERFEDDDGVEIATEVVEENDLTERSTPSPMFPSDGAMLKHENEETVVGLLTARLEGVEIAQEGRGLDSIIKIQCKSVGVNECTSIAWNEFQKKFAARCRTWPEAPQALGSPTQKRALKIRLSQRIDEDVFNRELSSNSTLERIKTLRTTNPRINLTDRPGDSSPIRSCITTSTSVFLDCRVDFRNEDKFVLHMTTAMGLADFVEDEIIPTPFPLQLEIVGVNLEMIEDRPPANITSPGPVPILVSISNPLPIARDKHGVFQIGERSDQTLLSAGDARSAAPKANHTASASKRDTDLLQEDLEKTLKQLDLAQKKNSTLKAELECVPELKMMVVQLQEQVVKLQEEKSTHLSLLRKYQNHNSKS